MKLRGWGETGVNKQIILLNGPSSSGKSSLAEALRALIAERRKERYEIVSIDDFMRVPKDETIYEDDVFEISGAMCESMREALESASGVIVDHVITSERIFTQFTASCAPFPLRLVRVSCPLELLRIREKERGDRHPGSAEASLKYLYPGEGYDLTVETQFMTARECAEFLFEALF